MKHYQMYIDGEWCDAEDGATPESINPATTKVWATTAVADYYYYFAGLLYQGKQKQLLELSFPQNLLFFR